MLMTALVLLIIAALGGVVMATHIFKGNPPPKAIAIVHGLAVVAAIFCLLFAVMTEAAQTATIAAFVLSLLTASGGIYLVSRHIAHKPHPRTVVVIHGLLATVTIVTLVFAVL